MQHNLIWGTIVEHMHSCCVPPYSARHLNSSSRWSAASNSWHVPDIGLIISSLVKSTPAFTMILGCTLSMPWPPLAKGQLKLYNIQSSYICHVSSYLYIYIYYYYHYYYYHHHYYYYYHILYIIYYILYIIYIIICIIIIYNIVYIQYVCICIYIIIYCNIILYVQKTKLTIVYLINYLSITNFVVSAGSLQTESWPAPWF